MTTEESRRRNATARTVETRGAFAATCAVIQASRGAIGPCWTGELKSLLAVVTRIARTEARTRTERRGLHHVRAIVAAVSTPALADHSIESNIAHINACRCNVDQDEL